MHLHGEAEAVIRAANTIAAGASPFIHGDGYYVACDVLREPDDPGLVFNSDEDSDNTRLTVLAFVLAVLSDP